jgi:hypothetical protein
MMGKTTFYRQRVLPLFIDWIMAGDAFSAERQRALKDLSGPVLEIGFGTGLNLPFYPKSVTEVIAVDPVEPGKKFIKSHQRLKVQRMENSYMKGPRIATYLYSGQATKA